MMKRLLTILTLLSALLGTAPFLRPRTQGRRALLWLPKLAGGALSPIAGLIGALAALSGLARRDGVLAGAGLLGVGLAARLIADQPDIDQELAGLPKSSGRLPVPIARKRIGLARSWARQFGQAESAEFERDLVFGHHPTSGEALRADLWPPLGQVPSGVGVIYAHGSGWRVGDKDLGTRPFFRRLATRGHLVLDIAYSLWPAADLPTMVAEVNQAILWLKEHGSAYGVRPDRIVLMGGSAGAHLALLAAYAPEHPAFRPAGAVGDTRVRGVVAFYPPVDLLAWEEEADDRPASTPGWVDQLGQAIVNRFLATQKEGGGDGRFDSILTQMLGGTPDDIPDTYCLLSPVCHVGAHCPPTLLLQGSDDVFGLAPAVRRLHDLLLAAGVPARLLEFPHTEHGFDLVLPHISPTARAATAGVERFLAWLT